MKTLAIVASILALSTLARAAPLTEKQELQLAVKSYERCFVKKLHAHLDAAHADDECKFLLKFVAYHGTDGQADLEQQHMLSRAQHGDFD